MIKKKIKLYYYYYELHDSFNLNKTDAFKYRVVRVGAALQYLMK